MKKVECVATLMKILHLFLLSPDITNFVNAVFVSHDKSLIVAPMMARIPQFCWFK